MKDFVDAEQKSILLGFQCRENAWLLKRGIRMSQQSTAKAQRREDRKEKNGLHRFHHLPSG
jgi:hypothetical protein